MVKLLMSNEGGSCEVQPPTRDFRAFNGVLFDVDGTLADSWKLGFDATLVILEKYGYPAISQDLYHECTRYTTPDRLARHAGLEPGHIGFEELGAKLAAEFDEYYVSLVSMQTAGFYPGIYEMIENIPPHVGIGALTNAANAYAHAVLRCNTKDPDREPHDTDRETLYDRFGSIRGADNVPAAKPQPDGLLTVCKDLDLDPTDCVYIGDSPSDGWAAAAAGMHSIGVLWGSHSRDSLLKAPFTCYCETVEELRSLLPQI